MVTERNVGNIQSPVHYFSSLMILINAVSRLERPIVNSGKSCSLIKMSNSCATDVNPFFPLDAMGTSKRVATSSIRLAPGILAITVSALSWSRRQRHEK